MSNKMSITAEYVRSILDYDSETGIFTWKRRPVSHFKNERYMKYWHTRCYGKPVEYKHGDGYLQLSIDGKQYLAHRIVFLIMTGDIPKEIDHINNIKTDNRWENLRAVNRTQNNWNRYVRKDSSSGIKGVVFHPNSKKWRAQIRLGEKTKHIGLFHTKEEAGEAFADFAKKIQGEYYMEK
jgi:hypothetical protein